MVRKQDRNAASEPAVDVVVTAFNQPDTLRLVLESLAAQTRVPDRVLVADDGSGPAVVEMLRQRAAQWPFAVSHVWQPDDGFRPARARNNAISVSTANAIAFLDQDVLPVTGWLAAFQARLAEGRVCLGESLDLAPAEAETCDPAAVRNGGVDALLTAARQPALRRLQRRGVCYAVLRRLGLPLKTKPRLKSGNFMVRRAALLEVNGFDEAYRGWGLEDDDLGRRLYRAGIRPVICHTAAPVLHLPHPPRRPADWQSGANLERFRTAPHPTRCQAGLDRHPHPDVTVTTLQCTRPTGKKHSTACLRSGKGSGWTGRAG